MKIRFVNFFILLLLINISPCYSQECEFKRNETDSVSHKFVRITKDFNVYQTYFPAVSCDVRLIQNDSLYFVKILYSYGAFKPLIIPEHTELIFYFENDSITLSAVRSDTSYSVLNGENAFYVLSGKYSIEKRYLKTLADSTVKKIIFFTMKKTIELDIKEKGASVLKANSLCFLSDF